jgi:hypothetical protein
MSDNLIRKGEDKAVSFKPNAYDRAEKLEELGIELPAQAGKTIDKLIEMAEQLQEAQEYLGPEFEEEKEEIENKQEALGLE